MYYFSSFLTDVHEYHRAVEFWNGLWEKTPSIERLLGGWKSGWFTPQGPLDGNPIFSAVSESQKKGVRVIQYEPPSNGTVDFWLDTYGGLATDPSAIRELVIACALSDESAQAAIKLMSSWVSGDVELVRRYGPERSMNLIRSSAPRAHEFVAHPGFGHLKPAA